jgi:hypothetical protein
MSLQTEQLAIYIRGELENLAQIAERAKQRIESARRNPADTDSYIEAAALNLQSFYTAAEQIFTRIAETVNGIAPDGESWHADLLRQMTYELPGRRPAILRPVTHDLLDELRGFRHRVRNIYTFRLNPERVGTLVGELPRAYKALAEDLEAFLKLLDQLTDKD